MIFVREINDDLTGLVSKLDKRLAEAAAKHKPQNRYGVYLILRSDDATTQKKFEELVAKGGHKHVVLCTTDGMGESRNKLAREAAVTVSVYADHQKVSSNVALKSGELD